MMNVSLPEPLSAPQLAILRQILYAQKLSRQQLTTASGYQLLTVTKSVASLIESGLLIEAGHAASSGGRKASLLAINPHYRYVLVACVAASYARVGVIGMDGSLLESATFQKDGIVPFQHLTPEELLAEFRRLTERYGRDKILGAGIGISGIVRHSEGRIIFCPNLLGWNDLDVNNFFADPLGIPVYVDTTARVMTLAESTFGAGRGIRDMICVSIGNSVGAGILIDGRLIRGADDAAGELGHTTVRDDVIRCTCGNRGCLESYVTLQTIRNAARRELTRFRGYSILRSAQNEAAGDIPAEAIRSAALHGDKISIKLLGDCADTLGISIANMVNLFNPRLVLLGGSVIEAFPELMPDIERTVRLRSLVSNQQRLLIRSASLGTDSPLIGAGLQVIHKLLGL